MWSAGLSKVERVTWWKSAAGMALAAILMAAGAGRLRAQDRLPVDRWLISSAFPADSTTDSLEADYLVAPGEAAVLPDRGRTVSGAEWTLVREDGAVVFELPERVEIDAPEAGDMEGGGGPVVAYAHAYIRAPADRTIRLLWGGAACTRVQAWLNGRPVDALGRPGGDLQGIDVARSAEVRIGFGYNTLLLKALAGDCEFGVAAALEAIAPEGLQGIRVQASRPYGDTRTGPRPWVLAGGDGGPEPILGWKGDRLFGAAGARLAAFAVTPVERVTVEARVGGQEIEREIEWLEPAEPRLVLMPFDFERLRRAILAGEGMELGLDWADDGSRTAASLDAGALLDALHSSIRLLGWMSPDGGTPEGGPTVAGAGDAAPGDTARDPHPLAHLVPLPKDTGRVLLGEWKVPGWLEGFTLQLDTDGAPGLYRIASRESAGGDIVLCDPCREGQTVRIEARTAGPWERFPGARIAGLEHPATDGTAADAARWLRLLDRDGNRDYRERAAAAASEERNPEDRR